MISDLNTFLTKAIPDTKLTVKRYLDVKFEYLVSVSRRCPLRCKLLIGCGALTLVFEPEALALLTELDS